MTSAPRYFLCLLLMWLQVLSPWVHAHTGEETGGFLHVPGLEKLAQPAGGCTLEEGRRDPSGVLVAMQSGARASASPLRPGPGPVILPPPPAPAPAGAGPLPTLEFRTAPGQGPPPGNASPVYPDAPPRAPPAACRTA